MGIIDFLKNAVSPKKDATIKNVVPETVVGRPIETPSFTYEYSIPIAPIIESYQERGNNKDFRRPNDSVNIKRINQDAPQGLPKKLFEYINVVGISYEFRAKTVMDFILGSNRMVRLEREPDNPHDAMAIKVMGTWREDNGMEHDGQFGYIPADISKQLANQEIIGATLRRGTHPE
jgi:hypothetical protein